MSCRYFECQKLSLMIQDDIGMKNQIRAIRLLAIIKLLEEREQASMARLCRLLRLTKRTVYRDIQMLREAGVPIYLREGIYRLNKRRWASLRARDLLRKR